MTVLIRASRWKTIGVLGAVLLGMLSFALIPPLRGVWHWTSVAWVGFAALYAWVSLPYARRAWRRDPMVWIDGNRLCFGGNLPGWVFLEDVRSISFHNTTPMEQWFWGLPSMRAFLIHTDRGEVVVRGPYTPGNPRIVAASMKTAVLEAQTRPVILGPLSRVAGIRS
jgi:hypothetical protein